MRSGVADCICLAAGGRLPKQRARQITQMCIPHPNPNADPHPRPRPKP